MPREAQCKLDGDDNSMQSFIVQEIGQFHTGTHKANLFNFSNHIYSKHTSR